MLCGHFCGRKITYKDLKINSLIILLDCGIDLTEVPPTPEAVSIVAHHSVDHGRYATPVHPITAGSAKLPDWLIKEAEETSGNNIRDP